jgi:ribonuclease P protein 1
LAHNSIFLRFYETTINQFYNNRLIQAMQFGQKLVVDCGYDNSMTDRENKNCAKQLTFLFSENRSHDGIYSVKNIAKKFPMRFQTRSIYIIAT